MMKLLSSPPSPYGRKVKIVAAAKRLADAIANAIKAYREGR